MTFDVAQSEPSGRREPRGQREQSGQTLVAGIGNVFLSDDAFGVEVARRLARRTVPEGVYVEDVGIRGVHLAYELLDGYRALVLIDAVPMGEPPGTLAVIDPTRPGGGGPGGLAHLDQPVVDAHTMSPDVVLATLAHLGGSIDRVLIIGCQPAVLDEGMGLSPAVEAAVDAAVDLSLDIVAHIAQPVERGTSR